MVNATTMTSIANPKHVCGLVNCLAHLNGADVNVGIGGKTYTLSADTLRRVLVGPVRAEGKVFADEKGKRDSLLDVSIVSALENNSVVLSGDSTRVLNYVEKIDGSRPLPNESYGVRIGLSAVRIAERGIAKQRGVDLESFPYNVEGGFRVYDFGSDKTSARGFDQILSRGAVPHIYSSD